MRSRGGSSCENGSPSETLGESWGEPAECWQYLYKSDVKVWLMYFANWLWLYPIINVVIVNKLYTLLDGRKTGIPENVSGCRSVDYGWVCLLQLQGIVTPINNFNKCHNMLTIFNVTARLFLLIFCCSDWYIIYILSF